MTVIKPKKKHPWRMDNPFQPSAGSIIGEVLPARESNTARNIGRKPTREESSGKKFHVRYR